MTRRPEPGYFTPARVERLFRHSIRHFGYIGIGRRLGIGCPCCGRDILAPASTATDTATGSGSGRDDNAICDALAEHCRRDCTHPGYARDLLDEPAPEEP